jgi:hypothetical protein
MDGMLSDEAILLEHFDIHQQTGTCTVLADEWGHVE